MDCDIKSKYNEQLLGKLGIFFTYTLWGVQSLYWKELSNVSLPYILAQRIIWSFVFLIMTVFVGGHGNKLLQVLKDTKKIKLITISAMLILANWFLNIYAVYSNQIIEASLGHYMTPIFSVVTGIIIFKEKMNYYHKISLAFAGIGVIIMMFQVGKIPLVAVLLTLSFSGYSIVKKITNIDSIVSITIEMGLLIPLAIIYLFLYSDGFMEVLGSYPLYTKALLAGTGLFTAIPLLMFSYGVNKVAFSITGYIQFLAPTLSLIIGIFVFHEQFSTVHFLSFGFIWMGIFVYLLSLIGKR